MTQVVKKICAIVDRKKDGSPIWQKVGVLIEKDNGSQFIALNRSVNLAGLEYDNKRNDVILNMFDLDDQQQKPQRQKPSFHDIDDDDIPF